MRKTRLIIPIILGISISTLFISVYAHGNTASAAPTTGNTYHVDADITTGLYNGLSWTNAFTNVNDALAAADDGDQIWVAEGIYFPDEGAGKTNNASSEYFYWNESVGLYGGFDPSSGIDVFDERDWKTYPTVLSGDITQDDTTNANGVLTSTANIVGSNTYNILFSSGLTESAVMDGFFFTGGTAGAGGGGIQMVNNSPTFVNLVFSGNYGATYGGGIYIRAEGSCSPSFTNVTFTGNSTGYDGGGMMSEYGCDLTLNNVTFLGNNAADEGGGFYNSSNTVMKNVIFSGNTANEGGGLYNSGSVSLLNATITGNDAVNGGGIYNNYIDYGQEKTIITNTIIWGNTATTGSQVYNISSDPTFSYSDIQGSGGSTSWDSSLGTDDGFNIDANPLFVRDPTAGDGDWTTHGDNDYGDLHLRLGSPAVDTGTNTDCPAFDLDGNPRPLGPSCDMGAFERLITIFLTLVFR